MSQFSSYKSHIIIIVSVAIVVRILFGYFMGDQFKPTVWEYERLTQSMINQGTYSIDYREYGEYKALLSPGFSFFCYPIYKLFGTSHIIILICQFLFHAGLGLVVYTISMRFFNLRTVALIAALATVLHPGLVHYSATMLHQFNLYILLFYLTT